MRPEAGAAAGIRRLGEPPAVGRVAAGLGLVLIALVGLALALTDDGRAAVAGGVALVLAVATPICLRLRTDPLDAVGIYGLASAAFFGAMSLIWLGDVLSPPPGVDRDDVASALVLIAAALAAFGITARLTVRARRASPVHIDPKAAPSASALAVLFGISLCATAIGIAFSAFGYLSDPASASGRLLATSELARQISGMGAFVVLACALVAFTTNERRYLHALAIFVPLQVVGGFLIGFKADSIAALVYVGVAYVATRERVPWRTFAITAAVLSLVLIPANVVYRTLLSPENQLALTPTNVAGNAYAYAGIRFRLVDNVALIQDRTPDVYPYANGDRYLLLPALIAIPRAAWPDKPVLDFAEEFSHTYWDVPWSVNLSQTPTQVGDLFRNFGFGGAVLGLAIWGVLVGALVAVRRRWRSPRVEMVYLASLFIWVWNVELDLPMLIAITARTVPVAIAIAWLALPGVDAPPGYRRILGALQRRRGLTSGVR